MDSLLQEYIIRQEYMNRWYKEIEYNFSEIQSNMKKHDIILILMKKKNYKGK